ncbi:Carboxylesterase NlhH [Nitrospira sp. KM1]|uniref:alpha/beta hydrolase n=1 Tax=Nitrospira sp. KM1 TaxID=1936990 RepID=UPI0013A72430|nr:alpha/beta hydrolase [Nitrospira sp. KM1]BCA53940.1 Carboxylesterase NlhH [Nitrospira sp. KM1]
MIEFFSQTAVRKFFMSMALLLFLTGCQSYTETYGGQERKATSPTKKEIKAGMTATLSRADTDMQAVLTALQDLAPKPIESLSAEEARKQPTPADAVMILLRKRSLIVQPEIVGLVENRTIPGPDGANIPVRVYTPLGKGPFPMIVYFHGGGWVFATLDTYDSSARALTNAAGAVVLSVEYRKGPEHRFPAAHEDAFAAYHWAQQHGAEIHGDPARVAVAGESAGGNLAAAVPIMARERRVPLPVHQLLIYPVTSQDLNSPSYRENADAIPLNRAMMPWFFEKYLNTPQEAEHPWISVVNARSLKELPPATILTADIDPLRSDGTRYADRLREAGVPVLYMNYEGVTHEFFGMGAVVLQAKRAVETAGTELRHGFETGAPAVGVPANDSK